MQNLSSTPEHILRRLEWTVIRRLDGVLLGDYRTLMRGAGLDLADLREYQHGDDVRHIDWNVTARLQTPYVREYTEDREVAAWFLLDLSASADFGSSKVRKRAVAANFVALISRLLTRHGNRVGAILYGTGVDEMIPARASRRHVLHLMQRILSRPEMTAGGETRLLDLLLAGANFLQRRSTVFIVSDFISVPGWEQALGQLTRRHEVTAVRLSDPLESALPDLGWLTMEDAETGEQLLVDTHDSGFRARLSALSAEREAALRQSLAAAGVDALELSTDDDLFEAVLRFTDLRKRRARGAISGHLLPHSTSVAMVHA
jgi:uncharacterized protein (DUF58 family)